MAGLPPIPIPKSDLQARNAENVVQKPVARDNAETIIKFATSGHFLFSMSVCLTLDECRAVLTGHSDH